MRNSDAKVLDKKKKNKKKEDTRILQRLILKVIIVQDGVAKKNSKDILQREASSSPRTGCQGSAGLHPE